MDAASVSKLFPCFPSPKPESFSEQSETIGTIEDLVQGYSTVTSDFSGPLSQLLLLR